MMGSVGVGPTDGGVTANVMDAILQEACAPIFRIWDLAWEPEPEWEPFLAWAPIFCMYPSEPGMSTPFH